jgi:hypothetical protein
METMLRRGLELVRCGVCEVFIDYKGEGLTNSWKTALKDGKIYRIMRSPKRDLLFSRRTKEDWRRMYICKDCVEELWAGLALEKG